jgi:hypothetical protein
MSLEKPHDWIDEVSEKNGEYKYHKNRSSDIRDRDHQREQQHRE